MIILKLGGGLANQMYMYAAGYALARELNQELALDISLSNISHGGGYALDNFKIPCHKKIVYDMPGLENLGNEKNARIRELFPDYLILVRTGEQKQLYPGDDKVVVYRGLANAKQQLGNYENIYMDGYFFDPGSYFEKYWGELVQCFTPKVVTEDILEFKNKIAGKTSVGVHIRRGDMLLANWAASIEDDYYRAAIECYREMYDDCIFCIFSDDIEYAREMLGEDESIYYTHFSGFEDAALNELVCLALCNHRVISNNSTFGRITDDLNYANPARHIIYRDLSEATIGKSIELRKKEHRIFLNKEDVETYSSRFVRKTGVRGTATAVANRELERFLELVKEKRFHEALQWSYMNYFIYQKNEEFIAGLSEALMGIDASEEALLEFFNLSSDKFKCSIANNLSTEEYKEKLLSLYDKNRVSRMTRFILVMNAEVSPANQLYGMVNWIAPLVHMGNKVSIVYETSAVAYKEYFKKKRLYASRGADLGCEHYEKKQVLSDGVEGFYNQFSEDEIIVISRDCNFFKRENTQKKIVFVTTDVSDRTDSEIGSLRKAGIKLIHELELADYVITTDERLKEMPDFIYCEPKIKNRISIYDKEWGYSHNRRMEEKSIQIIYNLLERLF